MFEGSEKKIEIIFSERSPSLRSLSEKTWRSVVEACKATIISSAEHSDVTAYLLSESSLFVWDHRLVLITCGKTVLPNALNKILKFLPSSSVDMIFYQRKNEFFPWAQKSYFSKDVKKIEKKFKGHSYQFGSLHDHHFLLFHSEGDYHPDLKDKTLEVLMYDSGVVINTSKQVIENLKKSLEAVLPGFTVQDYFFSPSGYSLNAIRGSFYYTIHITPEKSFFYISFETNFENSTDHSFINKIINIFKSKSFDLIVFQPNGQKVDHYNNSYFSRNSFYHHALPCGYDVTYMNFNQIQDAPKLPWVYGKKEKGNHPNL